LELEKPSKIVYNLVELGLNTFLFNLKRMLEIMTNQKILATIELPTLSHTLKEIILLKNSHPKALNTELGKIIQKDPLLSAHILKLVNSGFYNFKNKIDSISHSIGILGVDQTVNIAFSYSTMDLFNSVDFNRDYVSIFNHILKKTYLTASLANSLAVEIGFKDKSKLHLSCQVLYLGQIILLLFSPDKYNKIFQYADYDLVVYESNVFNTNFLNLGKELISNWQFPAFLIKAFDDLLILNDPKDIMSKIIHTAHKLAELILNSDSESYNFKEFKDIIGESFNIKQEKLFSIIESLPDKLKTFSIKQGKSDKSLIDIKDRVLKFISNLAEREKLIRSKTSRIILEKHFLSYLLDISNKLPSLKSDTTLLNFILEYFNLTMPDLNIAIYYDNNRGDPPALFNNKPELNFNFNQDKYTDFKGKSTESPLYLRLNTDESLKLLGLSGHLSYIFSLETANRNFGFFIVSHQTEVEEFIQFEAKYISILSSAISSSLANLFNYRILKNENIKKNILLKELLNSQNKLSISNVEIRHKGEIETINQILPTIFHKLKNHLTPILGYSQILSMKISDPKNLSRLSKIEENANKLVEQLGTLKDYFSIFKIKKENTNLNLILSNLKKYFSRLEKTYNLKISLELDQNLKSIPLNRSHIAILVKHISENSALAIQTKNIKEGLIKISTKLEEDHIQMRIEDNGIGIRDKELDSVFKLFHSKFSDRAGIGLSICENILKNHNSTISIKSKFESFTDVTIKFKSESLKEIKPINTDDHTKNKILILNHNSNIVELFKEILSLENVFSISYVLNDQDATALLKKEKYDCILSDLTTGNVENTQLFKTLIETNQMHKVCYILNHFNSQKSIDFLTNCNINYIFDMSEILKIRENIKTKIN
jgi:HD-like signal output (HDOD) protein/signal transduction histidine kinase